jgi:hypothetical protein
VWKLGIGTRLKAPSSSGNPTLVCLVIEIGGDDFCCSSASRRYSTAFSRVVSTGSLQLVLLASGPVANHWAFDASRHPEIRCHPSQISRDKAADVKRSRARSMDREKMSAYFSGIVAGVRYMQSNLALVQCVQVGRLPSHRDLRNCQIPSCWKLGHIRGRFILSAPTGITS